MSTSSQTTNANLRKAAVLLRSLDSDTAATMLGQLSSEEAASIRAAIRELGPLDPDEQADVVAEFRRSRPAAAQRAAGVELHLSSEMTLGESRVPPAPEQIGSTVAKRFEFLATASTNSLVTYLAREHAQTIAVVLSHLEPERAADVLAALPEKQQAETIERLSALGETDAESLSTLERELAAWMATRSEDRGTVARRREAVTSILAAAGSKTRRVILHKLKRDDAGFSEKVSSVAKRAPRAERSDSRYESKQAADTSARIRARLSALQHPVVPVQTSAQRLPPHLPSLPRIEFDKLVDLDAQVLAAVLHSVDPKVLSIALAASSDALVDRICGQMPKRTAREFRRQLRSLGPMRLSDVEAAQNTVAHAATEHLSQRRTPSLATT